MNAWPRAVALLTFSTVGDWAAACSACAPLVRAQVLDGDFALHVAVLALPVGFIGLIAWLVHGVGEERPR